MSEPIEPKQNRAAKALRTASKLASSQALALDQIFYRAVKPATPGNFTYHQDMRTALKAQSQYRATLKIRLALQREANGEEKSRNSSKRTIESGNSPA